MSNGCGKHHYMDITLPDILDIKILSTHYPKILVLSLDDLDPLLVHFLFIMKSIFGVFLVNATLTTVCL
jgi:hypothetical protein